MTISLSQFAGGGLNQAQVDARVNDRAPFVYFIPIGDEVTSLTTGTIKETFRMPFAMTLTEVPKVSLSQASTSGTPTIDINEAGVSILSTKITVDVSEKTSFTAAVPGVLSDTLLANDAEMTVDIDVSGTLATGLKIYLVGYKT